MAGGRPAAAFLLVEPPTAPESGLYYYCTVMYCTVLYRTRDFKFRDPLEFGGNLISRIKLKFSVLDDRVISPGVGTTLGAVTESSLRIDW